MKEIFEAWRMDDGGVMIFCEHCGGDYGEHSLGRFTGNHATCAGCGINQDGTFQTIVSVHDDKYALKA